MKNIRFFLVVVASIFSVYAFSQSKEQILNELKNRGINTQEELEKQMQKYGISKEQAEQQAQQKGVNYQSFVKENLSQKENIQSPQMIQKSMLDTPVTEFENVTENEQPQYEIDTAQEKSNSKYYGYNIFKKIPKAFQPTAVGPIDPGYPIAPGDILRIYLWGDVEFQYELSVNDQGNIFIPTVGQIFVSGTAYENLHEKLVNYLSKFYSGLKATPPTVFLDVSIARLRPVKIFALGEVENPGGYTVSSTSDIFNALYSIGGPLTSGSLRDIRVLRNNKEIARVDLYEFLLNGKMKGNVRIQNNDVIFIPPRLNTVTIEGEINRPAIYELTPKEGLTDLIKYASKFTSNAHLNRIQVNRIKTPEQRNNDHFDRIFIDVNYQKISSGKQKFTLQDGDFVSVFSILDQAENFVDIQGAIHFPGMYELKKGMKVNDLIKLAGGLKPEASIGKFDLKRTFRDSSSKFFSLNLTTSDTSLNMSLMGRDQVKIYSKYELNNRQNISISGYVKTSGTFVYADEMTLYDIIYQAGGLHDNVFGSAALKGRGDLFRFDSLSQGKKVIPFDLEKVLTKTGNQKLLPGDSVHIYQDVMDKFEDKAVQITGFVKKPGIYSWSEDMTPEDLIRAAGGFLPQASQKSVRVNRLQFGGYQDGEMSRSYVVEIEKSRLTGAFQVYENSFILEPNDVVQISKNQNFPERKWIVVSGSMKSPGAYGKIKRDETLLSVLERAGGPGDDANLYAGKLLRDGKLVSTKMDHLYRTKRGKFDIPVLEGDSIYIPASTTSVLVSGESNGYGFQKLNPGKKLRYYIRTSGGKTINGGRILLKKGNNQNVLLRRAQFWKNPKVRDGDEIVILPKPVKDNTNEKSFNETLTTILGTISTALTIAVLANRL